jgi:hypothetical protein
MQLQRNVNRARCVGHQPADGGEVGDGRLQAGARMIMAIARQPAAYVCPVMRGIVSTSALYSCGGCGAGACVLLAVHAAENECKVFKRVPRQRQTDRPSARREG